jgi:hypothetical protein
MQSGDQCTQLLFVCNCCDPLPVHVLSFDSLCYGLRLKYYNVKDFFHECKFPLAELEEQRYPPDKAMQYIGLSLLGKTVFLLLHGFHTMTMRSKAMALLPL